MNNWLIMGSLTKQVQYNKVSVLCLLLNSHTAGFHGVSAQLIIISKYKDWYLIYWVVCKTFNLKYIYI